MELTRRGLFGLLGGALLAKVIGPRLIAEPTAALWEAAKILPRTPIVNCYAPLEQVSARILRIVNENLKSLRLRQVLDADCPVYGDGFRMGDTVMVRAPTVFEPREPTVFEPREPTVFEPREPTVLVVLDQFAHASLDLRGIADACSFEELEDLYLRAAALALTEEIIRGVRHKGGGEVLVTGALHPIPEARKSLIVRDDEAGLVIRATQYPHLQYEPRAISDLLRIDILYGVG